MYFTNNSVHLTGASSVLSIGDAPKVFYNEVWNVGHLQTDGAVVQVMQGEAPGAEIAYNWIHDVIRVRVQDLMHQSTKLVKVGMELCITMLSGMLQAV